MVLEAEPREPGLDELIGEEWWFRAWAERESTLRFRRLAGALRDQGLPHGLVRTCEQAAEDEARHATLCAKVAREFHGMDPYANRPVLGQPLGSATWSPEARLFYEMVAFCCVTETLNTALLNAMYEGASVALVREALHELLADEVRHAQLGWAFLAHVAPSLDLAAFGPRLPAILDASVSDNLREPSASCAAVAAPSLGYLARHQRVRLFAACLRQVIFPGLARHGVALDGAQAWFAQQDWLPGA